jgi:hypothetical protein
MCRAFTIFTRIPTASSQAKRALPVGTCAFHHNLVGVKSGHPACPFPAIMFERTKLPLLDARTAIGFLDQCTGRDLRVMNLETNRAFVQYYQFPY